jgi:hypothetical protein
MAGTTKLAHHFTVKFHVVMSPEMKAELRKYARENNISEGQVVRQFLAEKFKLDKEHVTGPHPPGFAGLSPADRGKSTSTRRMFSNVPHPLEAAMRRVPIKKEEDDA